MPSMIRALAWCGTNAASSVGSTPARSQACSASGASAVVAQRKTACPSCWMYGRQPSMRTASPFSGAEPQTTGPMPAGSSSAVAVTTAAPAPSPKMMQVERSVQSVKSESFSAPMTIALRDAPARMAWSTVPSAYEKPEQAVLRSNAPGRGDAELGGDPAGHVGAAVDRGAGGDHDQVDVGGGQAGVGQRLAGGGGGHVGDGLVVGDPPGDDADPVRIHSSLVSTIWARSSLVSTREGW